MKRLVDLVEVLADNEECVVLKVKENSEIDLITLGCFNGDETMFRLTKGADHTCTVWTDEKHYSWSWGQGGHTLVTDRMSKRGRMIQKCIERDLGISIR